MLHTVTVSLTEPETTAQNATIATEGRDVTVFSIFTKEFAIIFADGAGNSATKVYAIMAVRKLGATRNAIVHWRKDLKGNFATNHLTAVTA